MIAVERAAVDHVQCSAYLHNPAAMVTGSVSSNRAVVDRDCSTDRWEDRSSVIIRVISTDDAVLHGKRPGNVNATAVTNRVARANGARVDGQVG